MSIARLFFKIMPLGLKTSQESPMCDKHQKEKKYPGCSKFSPKTLNKPVTIGVLGKNVIEHQCTDKNSCCTEGTTYEPLKTPKVKGLVYYHTIVSVNESSFPIFNTSKWTTWPYTNCSFGISKKKSNI